MGFQENWDGFKNSVKKATTPREDMNTAQKVVDEKLAIDELSKNAVINKFTENIKESSAPREKR